MTTTTLSVEQATNKLIAVRQEAAKKFARGSTTAQALDCGRSGTTTTTPSPSDPRLLDYIYESVFSSGKVVASAGGGKQQATLDSARNLIFALPDFKTAVERVAYSEDLLTRAVTLLEGIARCRLCGSNNTTVTSRQTLSSDEPPTMMLFCGSCHHRTNQIGE